MTIKAYTGDRKELVERVDGPDWRVLDLGCSEGAVGAALLESGKAQFVCGCEIDGEAAAVAKNRLNQVYVGDADALVLERKIKERDFDCLLLGDVLEHLVFPERTLTMLVEEYLTSNGRVVLSVPNIQHLETFIQLYIKGVWPRNTRGLFDATHLHFYTERTLRQDLHRCGLNVVKMDRLFRARDRVDTRFPRGIGRCLVRCFPNLFTHQFLVVCTKRKRADELNLGTA